MIKMLLLFFSFIYYPNTKSSVTATIFENVFIDNLIINGISTFLYNFNINENTTINNQALLNSNAFFANSNNSITLGSKNIIFNNLPEFSIGKNFLILNNNQLCILKTINNITIPETTSSYNNVFVNNIISDTDTNLQIGNTSNSQIQIGDNNNSNIIFTGNAVIFQGTLSTPNNITLSIINPAITQSEITIAGDLIMQNNLILESMILAQNVTINDSIELLNTTVNGVTTINAPINFIYNNGILNTNNQAVTIFGLSTLNYEDIINEYDIIGISKNNNFFSDTFNQSTNINAIDQTLSIKSPNIINIGNNNDNTIFLANQIIVQNTTITSENNNNIEFNFPIIFFTANQQNMTSLLFNDTLTINNINIIDNLFIVDTDTSCILNQTEQKNNITLTGNAILFFDTNIFSDLVSNRIVIDANNRLGIEPNSSYKKEYIDKQKHRLNKKNKIINNYQTKKANYTNKENTLINTNNSLNEEIKKEIAQIIFS